MHPSPNILHPFPQCNREKFKGKMTKKVVRNSENVDIFGGPRTETKFVKWSATRKRLRTAALEASIEMLAQNTESVIILGGDFNGLRESDVVQRTGLTPLIHSPTRGNNTLDKLFVSENCYSTVKIVTSAIKTDHKAIIALSAGAVRGLNKSSRRSSFRRRSPNQHAALLQELSEVDLSDIFSITETQAGWMRSTKRPPRVLTEYTRCVLLP